jgi:hypothetical protein
VTPDQDQHRGNRLLAALRPRDYVLLEPHLQIVPIGEGGPLSEIANARRLGTAARMASRTDG